MTHSRLYAAAWYEGGAKAMLLPRRPTSPSRIIHRTPASFGSPACGGRHQLRGRGQRGVWAVEETRSKYNSQTFVVDFDLTNMNSGMTCCGPTGKSQVLPIGWAMRREGALKGSEGSWPPDNPAASANAGARVQRSTVLRPRHKMISEFFSRPPRHCHSLGDRLREGET
jgi:hypothetical protein